MLCVFFCGVFVVIFVNNKNKGGVDGVDKQFFFYRFKEVIEGMENDVFYIVE